MKAYKLEEIFEYCVLKDRIGNHIHPGMWYYLVMPGKIKKIYVSEFYKRNKGQISNAFLNYEDAKNYEKEIKKFLKKEKI